MRQLVLLFLSISFKLGLSAYADIYTIHEMEMTDEITNAVFDHKGSDTKVAISF